MDVNSSETVGIRALNERLKRVETMTINSQQQQIPIIQATNQNETFLQTLTRKKNEKIEISLTAFEDTFYKELSVTFDLKNSSNFFVKIVQFTIQYIANNSINLGTIIGLACTGQFKFDMVLRLIKNLFSDVVEDLLKGVIQNTYDLLFVKQNDTKTILLLHNQIGQIDFSNLEKKEQKKKRKSLFSCLKA